MSVRRTSKRQVIGARVALLTTTLGVIAAIVAYRAVARKPSPNPSEHGTEATISASADTLALFTAMHQSAMSRMHDSMRVITAASVCRC